MRGGFSLFLVVVALVGCRSPQNSGEAFFYIDPLGVSLKTGAITQGENIVIKNEGEDIVLTLVSDGVDGSVYSVPVFGGSVWGKWREDGAFCGNWVDSLRSPDYTIPVQFTPKPLGNPCAEKPTPFIYETTLGKLVAEQNCDSVKGTILTPTGDYRYLNGKIDGEKLVLNTFDGAHLFLFYADIKNDSLINGVFKSGNHYEEAWSGVKTNSLEAGWSSKQSPRINHPLDVGGVDLVQLLDSLEKDVLVIDVMGTWCPNCYDEVRLIKSLKKEYDEALFISLAFERGDSLSALKRIEQFKEALSIDWEVLYGGVANKQVANNCVPFMGGIKSFPTTAFISKSGDVVVHTGFSGPATPFYEDEVGFYTSTLNSFIE